MGLVGKSGSRYSLGSEEKRRLDSRNPRFTRASQLPMARALGQVGSVEAERWLSVQIVETTKPGVPHSSVCTCEHLLLQVRLTTFLDGSSRC